MGPGRRAAVACILGVSALTAAGCGAVERANDPRPQVATRVSVTINPGSVTIVPRAIGVGPERDQQIPQNQGHSQPPIKTKAPQTVVFVVSNQTGRDSRLRIRGVEEAESGPIVANSPGSFQTALPTGVYTVSAGGSSSRFSVGPYRASSENDVLLP